MTVGRVRTISAAALWVSIAGSLVAPWQVSAQSGDDAPAQETPAGTPPQRENPRGVPGPDVLKRRLENLRLPAKTQTGRETGVTATTATPTPAVTAAAASTPPPPTPAPRPGTGSGAAGNGEGGQSFGTGGLVQTNPKSVKALPWNTKVTLGQIDDTDLEEVIKTISRVTARNFIYDKKDVRNQKVTILTPSALTVGEAYQAFQTALEAAGLTLVQVGPNLIRILPRRDAAQKPLDTEAGTSVPWNDSFVTRIIRLQNIDVGQIQGILQQLASKDGAQVQAFAPTNSLIITDTANNIRRLSKIIEELDRSGGEESIEVIQIKHGDVNDVADKISQLFGASAGAGTPAAGGRPAAGVRRPGNIKTPMVPVPGGEGTAPGAGASEAAPLVSKVIPDARTNQIIVVANERAMQALGDFLDKIDVFQDEGANIHVYYLENADAEELATVLSNLAQGQAGGGQGGQGGRGRFNNQPPPGGVPQQPGTPGAGQGGNAGGAVAVLEGDVKITSDKATNALVITASKSDYAAISSVIKKLDIRRQQVYVEAVIMELSVTRARELGLSFGGGFDAGDGAIGYGGLNAGNALFLDPARLATGFALGLIGAGGVDVTLADGSTLTIPPFGVALNALQTDSDVNVLSRPTILAKENEEAEIVVGTQIAIPGNVVPSAGGIPIVGSPTREDVGITLKVTPKINESDLVSMAISQEVKSAFPQQIIGTQRLVDLAKRSAKTNVVVKNGQTIVIGGLLSDEENRTEQKIPLLGDIPFLGWLFRNQTRRTTKTNLLIFLTPTIVNDEVDMQNIYQRRIREREEFLKLYGNRIRRKEAKRRLTLFESYYGTKEEAEKAEKKKETERAKEKPFEPVKPVEGAPNGTMTAPAERSTVGGDPPPVDPAAADTDDTPAAGETAPVDAAPSPTPAPAPAGDPAPTATPEPNP